VQLTDDGKKISCRVSNSFGSVTAPEITVVVDQNMTVTGDIQSAGYGGFVVYPNPVTDRLYVNLGAFDRGSVIELVIYDATGKVMAKILEKSAEAIVPVGSYASGNYFINASQHDQVYRAKFIKK
jgi:hypothetical protein